MLRGSVSRSGGGVPRSGGCHSHLTPDVRAWKACIMVRMPWYESKGSYVGGRVKRLSHGLQVQEVWTRIRGLSVAKEYGTKGSREGCSYRDVLIESRHSQPIHG
jgi:hypothetical protein